MTSTTSYKSVWDALHSDNKEEIQRMKALSEGMDQLIVELSKHGNDKTQNKSILTGRISQLSMADLFAEARIHGFDTIGLESICIKYNQPIPTL